MLMTKVALYCCRMRLFYAPPYFSFSYSDLLPCALPALRSRRRLFADSPELLESRIASHTVRQ
jgi:hypothetical protein